MGQTLDEKLVIGVSSTALFNFARENEIYMNEGLDAFRKFQRDNRSVLPEPGAAFPFIKRLLHLNKILPGNPVEVIILSKNHPDAGQRMMDALPQYDLPIIRAIFSSGKQPYPYMPAINASLYLSTDREEVRQAVAGGHPAGHVLPCSANYDDLDNQLRIAFDFDGVIVDDEAEAQFAKGGLPIFHHYEREHRLRPLKSGPLMPLLRQVSRLQKLERENPQAVNDPEKAIRIGVVTARSAPAHDRLITTLEAQGIDIDDLILTGGLEKRPFLEVMKPQIFFDDQLGHLEPAAAGTPCVHIPFGVRNAELPILPEPQLNPKKAVKARQQTSPTAASAKNRGVTQ